MIPCNVQVQNREKEGGKSPAAASRFTDQQTQQVFLKYKKMSEELEVSFSSPSHNNDNGETELTRRLLRSGSKRDEGDESPYKSTTEEMTREDHEDNDRCNDHIGGEHGDLGEILIVVVVVLEAFFIVYQSRPFTLRKPRMW